MLNSDRNVRKSIGQVVILSGVTMAEEAAGSGRVETTQPTLVQKKEELMVTPEFLTCAPALLPNLRTREEYQAVGNSMNSLSDILDLRQVPYGKTAQYRHFVQTAERQSLGDLKIGICEASALRSQLKQWVWMRSLKEKLQSNKRQEEGKLQI